MAFSSHATMEYISQIYFITPYRKCFLSLLMKRTDDKATKKNVTTTMVSLKMVPNSSKMVNLKTVPNNSKISTRNS
uniref:Ovule protein n=1 Tax=Acrobeloides nanus TaxID=290746 RepID=A0A914D0W5_9BILA